MVCSADWLTVQVGVPGTSTCNGGGYVPTGTTRLSRRDQDDNGGQEALPARSLASYRRLEWGKIFPPRELACHVQNQQCGWVAKTRRNTVVSPLGQLSHWLLDLQVQCQNIHGFPMKT